MKTPRNPHLIHPLHDIDMIHEYMKHTGQYFPQDRCTGRTTIQALEYIAQAIREPHTWIQITDHHDTFDAHRNLTRMCNMFVDAMRLKHFQFQERHICFSNIPNIKRDKTII